MNTVLTYWMSGFIPGLMKNLRACIFVDPRYFKDT